MVFGGYAVHTRLIVDRLPGHRRLGVIALSPETDLEQQMSGVDDERSTSSSGSGEGAVPEAQGQAALLLVESLIHGLIDKSVLTVAEAIEIIDIAAEVKTVIGLDRGEADADLSASLNALTAISSSLRRGIVE